MVTVPVAGSNPCLAAETVIEPQGKFAKSTAPNDNVLDCLKDCVAEATRTSASNTGPDSESTTNTRNSPGAHICPQALPGSSARIAANAGRLRSFTLSHIA